jgi:hypothetical protein
MGWGNKKHQDKVLTDDQKLPLPSIPGDELMDEYDLTKLPSVRQNAYLWYRMNKARYESRSTVDLVRGYQSIYRDAMANDGMLRELNGITSGFYAMFDAPEIAAFEADHPDVKAKVDAALAFLNSR